MKLSVRFYIYKKIALTLCVILLVQIFLPTVSYALTSGPSQPEVQSFEPITTTEMVDLFSGDFNYNIPLLEVPGPNGGYPINLNYNAGISMDQEASWVGLGWNLNPGAITRAMQGLPDEYNGTYNNQGNIKSEYDIKPNVTVAAGVGGFPTLELFGSDLVKASFGFDVRYNNYKGFGFTPRAGLSIGPELNEDNKNNLVGGLDLGVSLDNETGLGATLSAGLKTGPDKDNYSSYYVGVGYSQATGLSNVSFGFTATSTRLQKINTAKSPRMATGDSYKLLSAKIMGSSTLSFNGPGYLPNMTNKMETRFGLVSFKAGFQEVGIFANMTIHGTISSSYISEKSKNINSYGYLNAQNSSSQDMLDFVREQDGMIHKKVPSLPIPIASPDIYSMTSHGASTMFRAFRNDVGVYRDAETTSQVHGGVVGLEGVKHFGGNGSYTYGENYSGVWKSNRNNNALDHYSFKNSADSENEAWYFKSYGELTSMHKDAYNNIGNDKAMRLQITDNAGNDNLNVTLEGKDGVAANYTPSNQFNSTGRAKRNTAIQYIDNSNPQKGMYTITPEGSMYIYGKSQLVNKHIECIFAIDGNGKEQCDKTIQTIQRKNGSTPDYDVKTGLSDRFYSKKTMQAPYAYSYLITEIRGADFVDVDNNGIANDNDKGYWVKFSYDEVATSGNPYRYRTPFVGANYLRGKNTGMQDDKAQYIYGEKTISYLTSIETNSHIAEFILTDREDGLGAYEELNDANQLNLGSIKQKKISSIVMYSKKDKTTPLLKVVFEYSYDLCKGVENNVLFGKTKTTTNAGGKLTLKKVWIEYEKSKRGRMNAYQFDYDEQNTNSNPSYSASQYDRWGGYTDRSKLLANSAPNTMCDIPYIPQIETTRPLLDQYASAWSLKGITLPSGSKISVTYEADDYGYVQDRRAMQMMPIAGLGTIGGTSIANGGSTYFDRKVYFKLEKPISKSDPNAKAYMDKRYIGDMKEVYFRNFTHMLRSDDPRKDYVGGYAPIRSTGLKASVANGDYDYGYIELGDMTIGKKTFDHHPFCIATWQMLMTDYSELAFSGKVNADPNSSKSAKVAQTKALFSHFARLISLFTGFYSYAKNQNWGSTIDLSKSYIRLQTPDYTKVGGGIRVKKIVLSDQWDKMQSGTTPSVYGQYYEYTTLNDGEVSSSGVATYEPMIGGDENPFKTITAYANRIPLKLAKLASFEDNKNESYFPSPSVGYSKVTVKSLATYNNENRSQVGEVPSGIMTNGASINEFYTCKDYPVIREETPIGINSEKKWIPIPLIGSYLIMRLFATQGYCVQLNDMHGKFKRSSTYEQGTDGVINYSQPVTYLEHEYFADKTSTASGISYKLTNNVPLLIRNATGNIVKSNNYKLGEHIEFFTDMREEHVNETTSGAAFNVDLITIPFLPLQIPLPSIWPSFEHSENKVRIAVTNKVVHRFGILKSITAYNSGSTVKTQNLVFDGQTGQPVLVSITNNFNDPVYSYSVPASLFYEGMKSAASTVGLNFQLLSVGKNKTTGETKCQSAFAGVQQNSRLFSLLQQGDIIRYTVSNIDYYATISRIENGYIYVQADNVYPAGVYNTCTLIRPGRRNILVNNLGTITTLGSSNGGYNINPIDQLYDPE